MSRTCLAAALTITTVAGLSGCSARDVRDFAVDQTLHPRGSNLIRSVEHTAGQIADEEQAERVEALSAEYQEFLRESEGEANGTDDEARSVIMIDREERY